MSDRSDPERGSRGRRRDDQYSDSDDGESYRRRHDVAPVEGDQREVGSGSHKPGRRHARHRSEEGRRDDRGTRHAGRDHRGDDHKSRGGRGREDSGHRRQYRDRLDSRDQARNHYRSRSPPAKRRRRSQSGSRSPVRGMKSRAPLPSQEASYRGKRDVAFPDGPEPEKQKPNFKPTGLLAKEANTVTGTTTVLKYHEPPEARRPPPKEQWRMYVFKQKDLLDTVYLHQRSAWLIGRDKLVTDLLLEHSSISKQHAVIQFRYITSTNEYGDKLSKVKPYLIDLDSANGTTLNGRKIQASRFVELVDGDVVTFGESEREYVLMLPPP